MTLAEFRRLVQKEFGGDFRRMTPANVRQFLDRVQPQVEGRDGSPTTVHLNETESSYEGILRDFFRQVLDMPPDQAVIRLWLYGLEMAIASVSEIEEERLKVLFAGFMSSDGPD